MPTVTGVVLEVGPATVRLRPNRQMAAKWREEACNTSVSSEMITAALTGIDDRTVLLEERPVAVDELWQRIIAAMVEKRCTAVTVLHPSWWVQRRVERVVDAVRSTVIEVLAVRRSEALAVGEQTTVVEIAGEVVAVSGPSAPPVVLVRDDDIDEVIDVIENNYSTRVLIDAPEGVSGAAEYARAILSALRERGVDAQLAKICEVPSSASAEAPPSSSPQHWRGRALISASVVLTVCVIGVTAARGHVPAPGVDTANVVEGRIAFQVPTRWTVTRITAGPGSRRIQVSSPNAPNVALHVTQSYSPGEILDRTADVLRQAVAEQPRGVFVDFNPADRRGGRPAVTYREVRVGRDIRWTVLLDGSTRISVGCQSAPGREDTIAAVCERAIESVRELGGTNEPA